MAENGADMDIAPGAHRHVIDVDGRRLAVALRVAPRARRLSLSFGRRTDVLEVTMPPGVSVTEAMAFVARERAWIRRRLAELPPPVPFRHGATIPYRGDPHLIFHVPRRRGTVWREERAGAARLCVAGDARHLPRRLRDWLKGRARHHLLTASRRYAAAMGVTFRRLAVRDQVSRWGSCSATGTLSFSWRLIFAPPEVLDYLAAHEVAHLVHMNHSPAFWSLVRRHCPHMEDGRRWLRKHGRGLFAWGAEPGDVS